MQSLAHKVTEAIASKDRNNLYITSSFFKDPIKYRAFCDYYAIMRIVDDRVDNLPSSNSRSAELMKRELSVVTSWERMIRSCCKSVYPSTSLLVSCDHNESEAIVESFVDSYRVFPVPMELWTNFFAAMRSDIVANELVHWTDFLTYAEGATVAPTTIYLLLIVAHRYDAKNSYEIPQEFDLYDCGRHLGLFAYLGHIIRDLATDIMETETRLCLTREDMLSHNVSKEMLKNEALNQKASKATRGLVKEMLHRARWHLAQGRALIKPIHYLLERDSKFILELVIAMYEQVILKIESNNYDPMTKRHHLTRQDKARILSQVAARLGFSSSECSVI